MAALVREVGLTVSDKGKGGNGVDRPGGDDEVMLPSEESEAERRRRLRSSWVPLSRGIHDQKPVEWLVEGLIPKGCLILLAGEPKLSRKTVLSMELALCVALGRDFLGRKTAQGEVAFANLEDGYERTMRRYFHFGVRPDSTAPDNLFVLKGSGNLDMLEEYIRTFRPAICIVDPVVELELLSGVQDENDAREVAKMFKRLRDIAQETGTVIFAIHHYNKAGDVRGSTAFKGSTDGWFEIQYRRNKPRILRWTLRDAPEGEVDLNIEYEDDVARVELIGEFRDHHTTGASAARSGGGSDSATSWTARKAEVGERIRRTLSNSDQSYSINQLAQETGSNKKTVKEILEQFEEDEVVVREGQRWVYNPAPPEVL